MTAHQLIGVRQCADGRIVPVFVQAREALDHHRAAVAAHGARPFLPVAFGAVGIGPDAVQSWLESRHDWLATRFAETEGLVEMGLRLTYERLAGEPAPVASGRDFLRRAGERSAAAANRQHRSEAIVATAASLPGVARWRVLSEAQCVVSVALAVRREAGASVAAALEALAGDGLVVETSGPWPLYSFALSDVLPLEAVA